MLAKSSARLVSSIVGPLDLYQVCSTGRRRKIANGYSQESFTIAFKEIDIEQILINLVAGAVGGFGVGKSSPTFDLGTAGNVISGLVGGGLLGQIATLLLPSVLAAAQSGNLSVSGIVSQAVAGGAILTAIVGAIKNKAAA
ncbi:hypothetical protein [Bradyrhizobium japonicum]|uniref:hypothetical protein n=1 Tax=Bradyrhizobium japonicum TaxID=375 RepID=UPI0020110BB4|nr:hypothetical protein [Bradyrhizobium japonicum]